MKEVSYGLRATRRAFIDIDICCNESTPGAGKKVPAFLTRKGGKET
jgi:hypothetical protein